MNNLRRKAISELLTKLETFKDEIAQIETIGEEAKEKAEEIRDEEQEAFGNMPESLQGGEAGRKCETAVENLDSAVDAIQSAIDDLQSAVSSIEEAVSSLEEATA